MVNGSYSEDGSATMISSLQRGIPRPTSRFRLRAWREFQRAIDPLGPAKPLRQPRT